MQSSELESPIFTSKMDFQEILITQGLHKRRIVGSDAWEGPPKKINQLQQFVILTVRILHDSYFLNDHASLKLRILNWSTTKSHVVRIWTPF